ncbi:MAG TPA: sigma-70 family RNA polymerase sigma factor [Solirubrobacterales bacterium]|nr:sigma-70 family RNA polymerase sigma factor [Solirubrobacterales bacterium]
MTDYPTAARQLVAALAQRSSPDGGDLGIVLGHLEEELSGRFRTLSLADRNDVVGDTLMSVVGAAQNGKIDPESKPGGYIWRIAERRALDRLRGPTEVPLEAADAPSFPAEDDAIAARLDERARGKDVYLAMRLARADGNHRINRLVSEWLVFAQERQRAPSVRDLAERMGISHDTVARHLKIFAGYLERVLGESEG